MKSSNPVYRSIFFLFYLCLSLSLLAQSEIQGDVYEPRIGQAGKDVVWVPTPDNLVSKMLEIAEVTSDDYVIDLGSGDGRTVIAAARLGAKALGIEYNHDMILLSRKKADEAGMGDKVRFIEADLFEYNLSDATVITMFLLPDINVKLRPRLLELKPGTRIVSNTFSMGDWEPDVRATIEESRETWNSALMWIIPSRVDGIWDLPPGELTINQQYQIISGTYTTDEGTTLMTNGKLRGNEITFRINEKVYKGVVDDNSSMKGSVTTSAGESNWTSKRIE